MLSQFFQKTPLTLSIARESDEAEREGNKLDYLPFGVKTLKVVVEGDYKGKLRLHPKRLSPVDGEKFAHEDDEGTPPQFVVSWGGGHEDYYELDYPKKRFVHFLVHHVGDSLGDHLLTIEAEDETDQVLTLPVTLTYPTIGGAPWPSDQLVRPSWEEVSRGLNGACDIVLQGVYTPRYIPRWWPRNRIEYTYDKKPPHVRLRYRRLVDGNNGDLTVYASQPGDGEEIPLAVIRGSIGYPLYDMRQVVPEMYRLGPQTWVLRVWFFWLDLDISHEDLGRYWPREADELEQAWRGITKVDEGGLAERSWGEQHEIPDAERVDILFNDDLQPLYAATDLHWRELWGKYKPGDPGDLVQVQIMNTQAKKLLTSWQETWKVIEGWGSIILSRFVNNEPPYKPHLEVMAELEGQGKLAADPFGMESHSPAFLNIMMQRRFTSTDVTDG
jgi:hypothetical protein